MQRCVIMGRPVIHTIRRLWRWGGMGDRERETERRGRAERERGDGRRVGVDRKGEREGGDKRKGEKEEGWRGLERKGGEE